MGMSQQEVVQRLGRPDEVSAADGTVYLKYWHSAWYDHNGADGTKEEYYVRLINDRVNSFGRVGDFDSTKPPERTVNLNIKNR